MNLMMIQMGYIILFAFAAPGVVALVVVAFLVKMRVDAFKLCSVYQRPIPQLCFTEGGIGEWNTILKTLLKFGLWTCILIPVLNLEYFALKAEDSWIVSLVHNEEDNHKQTLNWFQKLIIV